MKKTKVIYGDSYWIVDIDGNVRDRDDWRGVIDSRLRKIGNYFTSKEEAEEMASKLRAVFAGADVIEMPSEEEMLKARPTFPMEYDPWDAKNIREGFESCYEWLKEKIMK